MRTIPFERALALAVLLVGFSLGCSGDSSPTGNGGGDNPGISISLSASSLSLEQAAPGSASPAQSEEKQESGSITITLTRSGGFTGAVSVVVEGAPNGVTATATPASIASGSSSSVLSVFAGAASAPGSYTLTVRATGSGVSAATATLALTVTARPVPTFVLAASPTTLSLPQGTSGDAMVAITRGGGFTGEVTLSVTGMPAGMTASANPPTTGGNSSTVTVTVGAGVAVGSYPLVVTGSTGTLADQTVSLSVSVTAGSGGGGNVSFAFCDESGLPVWVAYQDGNGAWMQAAGVNHTYSFNISSAKGAVAFVTDQGLGQFTTLVYYGTTAELSSIGGNLCDTAPGTSKTVNGSVAGLALTDQSTVTLGGSSALVSGAGPGTFSLQTVPDGPRDLVATRLELSGAGFAQVLTGLIIRRGLNPADGSTLAVLDFGSAEAFAPEIRNLTINNLGTDSPLVNLSYYTANGGSAFLFNDFSGSLTFPAVGASHQAAGDLHSLNVLAADPGVGVDNQRALVTFFEASADKTVTLGPTMGAVTLTTASAAPYLRLRAQHTVQAEYNSVWTLNFSQGGGSSVGMIVTAGHQGGDPTLDYTIPDFTGAAGWNHAWGLVAGTEVAWVLGGTGWTQAGGVIGSPLIDGAVARSASRFGSIMP